MNPQLYGMDSVPNYVWSNSEIAVYGQDYTSPKSYPILPYSNLLSSIVVNWVVATYDLKFSSSTVISHT